MIYEVIWKINDGRCGYPNFESALDCSVVKAKSYKDAIKFHADCNMVPKILIMDEVMGGRGKIRGVNYRDFIVQYVAKYLDKEKYDCILFENEFVEKKIRVFCYK